MFAAGAAVVKKEVPVTSVAPAVVKVRERSCATKRTRSDEGRDLLHCHRRGIVRRRSPLAALSPEMKVETAPSPEETKEYRTSRLESTHRCTVAVV
ncbi:hypothetical protein H6P81_003000 [Aristolochia fimbriata]|uniref:Uncharacterized protein n=1 Tax=Aristolochia fimbriata TaxID=158543 RepID=A0AAV7FFH5_ARIFI|nr:hypothetical protein H6P81_003000 [Aristolochia fimbriata]